MPSRDAATTTVLIDGVASGFWQLLSVGRTVGEKTNYATIELSIPAAGQRPVALQETSLQSLFKNKLVEVHISTVNGVKKVHHGRISAGSIELSGVEDAIIATSRLDHHMFGKPLSTIIANRALSDHSGSPPSQWTTHEIHSDLVFNPLLDGKITPNKLASAPLIFAFVDPKSLSPFQLAIDTAVAADAIPSVAATVHFWNLRDVVNYLCRFANSSQQYVLNPDTASFNVLSNDRSLVRNIVIEQGTRLPEALSEVLGPYGYDWKVEYPNLGKGKITIFERGTGAVSWLTLQEVGLLVNPTVDQAARASVNYDVSDQAVNQVTVLGDHVEIEATVELVPGWDESLDGSDPLTLRKSHEDWEDLGLHRVWRDWVLNESGDYTGIRAGLDKSFDFQGLVRSVLVANGFPASSAVEYQHRRKFLPTITTDDSGTPRGKVQGIEIEWSTDGGQNWGSIFGWKRTLVGGETKKMPGLPDASRVQVLQNECGIRIGNESKPPTAGNYINLGVGTVKFRVTARIKCDTKVVAYDDLGVSKSLLVDGKHMVVDMAKRYKLRLLDRNSLFWDSSSSPTLHERNDAPAALNMAKDILGKWSKSTIDGKIVLEGLDSDADFFLGKPISDIRPRNINFTSTHPTAGTPRYPMVVAIAYDVLRQEITLDLDEPTSRQGA
tara:strand:- start:6701 stop:8698 length:1998 start_codon:yes stop_codon:yes gene_type:complete